MIVHLQPPLLQLRAHQQHPIRVFGVNNRHFCLKKIGSQMVLRVKSSDKMKKIAQGSVVSKRETRPKSKSRLKSKQQQQQQKKTKFDAKMPKKPPTAFFYFLEDFRKEFQEQNPNIKSMRDIGKACGEKWKTMTYEEKVKYYDIATEKRAEFDRAMAEYNKRKESGEDEETEDDSDYEE